MWGEGEVLPSRMRKNFFQYQNCIKRTACELLVQTAFSVPTSIHVRFTQCATYSITSSAREIIVGGTDKPIAFAAFKLTTSSNFVGSCTGSSAGFAPFRMRSTYDAARPNSSGVLLPKEIRPPLSTKYRSL